MFRAYSMVFSWRTSLYTVVNSRVFCMINFCLFGWIPAEIIYWIHTHAPGQLDHAFVCASEYRYWDGCENLWSVLHCQSVQRALCISPTSDFAFTEKPCETLCVMFVTLHFMHMQCSYVLCVCNLLHSFLCTSILHYVSVQAFYIMCV
jgi:hypothetical protein